MANQHTKKAKEKARRAAARENRPAGSSHVLMPTHLRVIGLEGILKTPLMNKADEKAKKVPHFTLLPSDNFTPGLVRAWIAQATTHGTPEAKVLEAKQILKNIEDWRTANPTACKTPD